MQPDQPSPPDWLKNMTLPMPAALLVDPAAAQAQADADQVLRDLIKNKTENNTLRSRLQDAMWTKANFNIVIDGRPLIHHIIDRRDISTLLLVISGSREKEKFVRGGDTDGEGRTAIDYARALGWDEGASYLDLYGRKETSPGYGAVVNVQTQLDKILAAAAENNDVVVARSVLALGADPNVKSRHDLSAFHHCILLLHGEMVGLLAEYGADINARHFRGETSLQMLWWCHSPRRLNAAWYDMADRLRALGCDPRDFKTPREMTAVELTQEPPGAYKGARAMDYALQAKDFVLYRRGFAALGSDKAAALLKGNTALQEMPINYITRGRQLHEILQPNLWYGQGPSLRRVWAAAAEELARPQQNYQWRDGNSKSFTVDDFSRLITQVDLHMIAARDKRKFKL